MLNIKVVTVIILSIIGSVGLLNSCSYDEIGNSPDHSISAGGATTVDAVFSNAFQIPAPNMDENQNIMHRKGDVLFESIFVTPPSPVLGGLGPIFVQNSCANCHKKNGSAAFPLSMIDMGGILARVSLPDPSNPDNTIPVPGYGSQIQTKSTFGIIPEAKLSYLMEYINGTMEDGTKYTLAKPNFILSDFYTDFPAHAQMSARIAPPIFGLGLLEAISEKNILSRADPDDSNHDGISGRANYVYDIRTNSVRLGRFGWKANQTDLYNQTAQAFLEDMGITSPYLPHDPAFGQLQDDKKVDDPEIDNETVRLAAFYTQSLGVPAHRDKDNPDIIYGEKLFHYIGCQSCHVSSITTSQHPEYDFLSNQKIQPYTDLLLHDMGEGLADHRPDGKANGFEWRTPPLWGIGLTDVVGGHSNFLHDGRARNIEEAILWHGGEAEKSKVQYTKLSKRDREKLLLFLRSI